MSSENIIDFLEARITEDEAVAKAATAGPWEWEPETDGWGDCGPNLVTVAKLPPYKDGSQSPVEQVIGSWGHDANGISVEPWDAQFMVRNAPHRVLAECAAKRAIIEAHPITHDVLEVSTHDKFGFACATCFSFGDVVEDHGYCDTLRALAAVYSDHPDYQQKWAL